MAAHGVGWLDTGGRPETLAAEILAAGGIMSADDLVTAAPRVSPLLRMQVGARRALHTPFQVF